MLAGGSGDCCLVEGDFHVFGHVEGADVFIKISFSLEDIQFSSSIDIEIIFYVSILVHYSIEDL